MNVTNQGRGWETVPVEPDESPAMWMSIGMDDEAGADELDAVLRSLGRDPSLGLTWASYHVIGEALRGELPGHEGAPPSAFLARVRERLAAEGPAVVAPSIPAPPPAIVRGRAANDDLFRWKLVAGVASLAAVVAIGWNTLVRAPGAEGVGGAQLAEAVVPPVTSAPAPGPTEPVVVRTPQGTIVRDARLMRLLAEHRQNGMSALHMPAGFLSSATRDGAPGR
jgi:sigma-E factor negative regulatory protein RseA